MTSLAIDILGWSSAAGVLCAYALVTRNPSVATSRRYLVLNVAGSAGLAANGVAHAAWPSAVLNALWLAFALHAVRHRSRRPTPSS